MTNTLTPGAATLCETLRRRARLIAIGLLLTVAPILTVGCYGTFPLTSLVYEVNGEITDEKIVHSIMLWIFIILPVYGIAMLVDFVVLNLIEFWTDDEIEIGEVREVRDDGTVIELARGETRDHAEFTVTRDGHVIQHLRFHRLGNGQCEVLDANNEIVGWVFARNDGTIELADAEMNVLRVLNPEDLDSFREAFTSAQAQEVKGDREIPDFPI